MTKLSKQDIQERIVDIFEQYDVVAMKQLISDVVKEVIGEIEDYSGIEKSEEILKNKITIMDIVKSGLRSEQEAKRKELLG